MIEISDFEKYTDEELRKILIDNAKPECGGMSRVVQAIIKKYNACDRDMLLWFIEQPPYYGTLWVPNHKYILTTKEAEREERKLEREIERQQKKRIEESKRRKSIRQVKIVKQIYIEPPKTDIFTRFKKLGCEPVLIDTNIIGIKSNARCSKLTRVAKAEGWRVIEL
jgi:hypothetical protein